jgi:hypothetical protein
LTLELQKPCGFLKGKWCGIYPGRPIGCAEFPEAWIQRGLQGWIEDKERFRLYPCLEGQRPISAEREAVLAELSEMAAQERWVSDFCLFGQSPFYVDLRNLVGDLTDMAHDLGMLPEKTDSTAPQRIPYPLIESFIQGKLKETGFQKEISKKVTRLNRLEERVWLFELRETIGEIQKPLGTEGFVIYNQFEGKSLRGYRGVRPRHR